MQGKLYCIAIVPILQNLDNDIVTQEYRYSEILTLLFVF